MGFQGQAESCGQRDCDARDERESATREIQRGGDEVGQDEQSENVVALAEVADRDGAEDENECYAEEPELVAAECGVQAAE